MVLPAGGEGQKSLQMDEKTAGQFVQWLRGLPKDQQILRVFDRKNDGFFVHDRDAYYVARTFYKSTTMVSQLKVKVDAGKDDTLESIHLNRSMFEALLQDVLITKGNRVVELYEGHGASWQVSRKASPGQLSNFEEELFKSSDMLDAPIIMSATSQITDGVRTVGIAYVDATGRRLGATQFDDDDQLCALERILVQLGAKECVLPQDSASTEAELAKLEQLCSECDVLVTRRPKASFNGKDIQSSFETLLKNKSTLQHEHILERPLACAALAGVLKFAEIASDSENHGRYHLELYNPENLMRLDRAAQSALHVFPPSAGARSSNSIYGLLNHSRTAMGKRLLRSWLKQPLTDVAAIQERHSVVKVFVDDMSLRDEVRDAHLRGMPDIQRLARKLAAHKITLQELCQLYMASVQLEQLVSTLSSYEGDSADLVRDRFAKELADAHTEETLVKFEQLMESAVDLDAVPEEYLIDAGYCAELQEVKDAKDTATRDLECEAHKVARDLELELDKTAKLEWFKSNNVSLRCLRITPKEEKTRRAKLNSKYIVLESRKDGTKFTSKKMRDCANLIFEHSQTYAKIQSDLLGSVRDVAATFMHIWERVGEVLAELDVLVAFAHAAATAATPYVCPEMLPAASGEITLTQSRHPCLEMQEGMDVIPNDCVMQRGQSWFHIITGPNMGGKSTFIRQVGVCVLMAQVGSFVPCAEARISVRDCIFARVGAGDCQQKGVSTFMAEMLETAAIMKGASERSLLIIDELGRGTSTYDGFGLAWALSEHIMQVIGAPTLFATHFHELTAIKGVVGVKNSHMKTTLDLESSKLTMLYNVAEGACDQSFGIHVAEFAGFPQEILRNARERLAELEAGGLPGGKAGEKRSRAELESGACDTRAALEQFLKEFAAAPLSDNPETAAEQLGALKQNLLQKSEENHELKNVLSSLGIAAC